MIAAGVFLLCVISVLSVKKRLTRMAHAKVTPAERVAALKKAHAPDRRRIESVMIDAEELTRRLAAHLDNKAAKIEMLLKEADDRIAKLQAETSQADDRPEIVTRATMPSTRARAPLAPETPSDPLARRIYDLADEGFQPVEIARKLEEHVGKVELILALRG